jgi:hypothetical protein
MVLVAGLAAITGCLGPAVGETDFGAGSPDGVTTAPNGSPTTEGTDDGDHTEDGDTTDDECGVFYGACPGDVGSDFECDVWSQDCPADEKCMPWANDGGSAWNAHKCSPLDPDPRQPGEECTVEGSGVSGVDNCEAGSMCWDVDPDTLEGHCVALCSGTPEAPTCSDSDTTCSILNDGVLPLCVASCDPVLQNCVGDEICVPTPDGNSFVCLPDASGNGGQYGDPCQQVNACDPGLFCAVGDLVPGCQALSQCCTEFCELTADDPNAACSRAFLGVQCEPWFEEGQAPPEYAHVGSCTVPP